MILKLFVSLSILLPLLGFSQNSNPQSQGRQAVLLSVDGWSFGSNHLDKDDSEETGKIVYQVRVDSNGNIVSARPMQQTVSPSIESFYRRQVLRFKLRPKSSITVSDLTVGTLTITLPVTQLVQLSTYESGNDQSLLKQDTTKNQLVIYLSVLRYRGKIIDVSPISRDFSGEEDYSRIVHKLSKASLEPSDALEMVSNYGWQATGNKLYKLYSTYNQKDPSFISRAIESRKIK